MLDRHVVAQRAAIGECRHRAGYCEGFVGSLLGLVGGGAFAWCVYRAGVKWIIVVFKSWVLMAICGLGFCPDLGYAWRGERGEAIQLSE